MIIKTSQKKSASTFINKLNLPKASSHKGQNGQVLIIGGSSLFHAASIWAAEIASYFVDIVHYSSTKENNQIFLSLKKKFRNGIIVAQKDLLNYVEEDDAVLVGPGMVRSGSGISNFKLSTSNFKELLNIKNESEYTYYLTKYLLENFRDKRFVIDAGALQMMKPEWLNILQQPAIITPHQKEFERLFSLSIHQKSLQEKIKIVQETAKKYKTTILVKAIVDIISDGKQSIVVEGGNQGLTKGGTGDLLAGLTVSLSSKNDPFTSAVLASYLLKKSAELLYHKYGYWYNIGNLIDIIPQTLKDLTV